MYGAILGDLVGFPFEYRQEDLTNRDLPLLNLPEGMRTGGPDYAGEIFSEKTVLTAALQDGLLDFEKKIPDIFAAARRSGESGAREKNEEGGRAGDSGPAGTKGGEPGDQSVSSNVFEKAAAEELMASMRRLGAMYPLAGYAMELSIWLFREGTAPSDTEDPGPAARVSPVPWIFQDDFYMMRRIAVLQAGLTSRNMETLKAADAAACMVFLALHGSTKDYIAGYLEREFAWRAPGLEEMKKELLYAEYSSRDQGGMDDQSAREEEGRPAGGTSIPALCVRTALTAFLHGKDFEDVLRLAVSLCGTRIDTAAVTAIAGAAAEAFFGIPEELVAACRRVLPGDILKAVDAFAARIEEKKRARQLDPNLKARWETALTRAGKNHPAAVQGNEELEQAIEEMTKSRDQKSLALVLEALVRRANAQGRLYVPVLSAGRGEQDQSASGPDKMVYRLQAVRTRDGKLWQPAYTSRDQLDKAGAGKGMVLSYSLAALLNRFLKDSRQPFPEGIKGLVLNPGGKVFFLPRVTIEALVSHKSGAGSTGLE